MSSSLSPKSCLVCLRHPPPPYPPHGMQGRNGGKKKMLDRQMGAGGGSGEAWQEFLSPDDREREREREEGENGVLLKSSTGMVKSGGGR